MNTNLTPVLDKLEELDATLAEHGARLAEHGRQFAMIHSRLEAHDHQFTAIVVKLGEHDGKFVELEDRLVAMEHRMMGHFDAQGVILQRLDQAMAAWVAWSRRTEDRLGRHEKRLRKLEVAR